MAADGDRPSIPARRLAKHLRYLCGREFRPLMQRKLTRILGTRRAMPSPNIATVCLRKKFGSNRLMPPARMVVYARPFCASRSSVPPGHLWPHDIWSYEWPFEA